MNCDVLTADNECHENVPCIQGRDTGPAATFILNSFVAMSNVCEAAISVFAPLTLADALELVRRHPV